MSQSSLDFAKDKFCDICFLRVKESIPIKHMRRESYVCLACLGKINLMFQDIRLEMKRKEKPSDSV